MTEEDSSRADALVYSWFLCVEKTTGGCRCREGFKESPRAAAEDFAKFLCLRFPEEFRCQERIDVSVKDMESGDYSYFCVDLEWRLIAHSRSVHVRDD